MNLRTSHKQLERQESYLSLTSQATTLSQWAELINSARSLKFCFLFSASPLTEICLCAHYHTTSGYSGSPHHIRFQGRKNEENLLFIMGI